MLHSPVCIGHDSLVVLLREVWVKAISALLTFAGVLAIVASAAAWFSTGDGARWWIPMMLDLGVHARWLLTPTAEHAQLALGFGALLFVLGLATDRKAPTVSTSHGSARFATSAELRRFGYSEASVQWWRTLGVRLGVGRYPHVDGVVVCMESEARVELKLNHGTGQLARMVKDEAPLVIIREKHVAIEGPPGSGKDVCIAVPSLYHDRRSVVVLDPKGNQYEKTAGARSVFSNIFRFAPTDPDSDRFNPLCVIPVGTPEEVGEAERISNALLGVLKDEKDASMFYSVAAQPLLTASILYVLHNETGENRSLPGALRAMTGGDKPDEAVRHICSGLPQTASELRDSLSRLAQDKKTLQSMFTTATNALSFCRTKTVANAISGSDFVPSDLYLRDAPLSLYLVLPFKDADQLRPLMRLVLNVLVNGHALKRNRNTCYYLNEFPSIGAVPAIPRAAAEIREYGVQFALFWQSEGQVLATYGREAGQALLDICNVRVLIGVTGKQAAETASELAGKTTLVRARKTKAVSVRSAFERTETFTEGEGEQARELLTANEIRKIPPDKLVLILPGLDVYLGTVCVSYSQLRWKRAFNTPAPAPYRSNKRAV